MSRVDDGVARVHQHGRAHVDHEPAGVRTCEFGPARPLAVQRHDVVAGRRRLEETLGRRIDPVFTPPWNRCTAAAAEAVRAGGPVGVMLHHAVMDDDDRTALRSLLDLVASSPQVTATTIMALHDAGTAREVR